MVKGCDERALVVLEKESQIDRKEMHVIGMACQGMGEAKCETCDVHMPRFADEVIGDADKHAGGDPRTVEIAGVLDGAASCRAHGVLGKGIRALCEVLRLPASLPDVLLRALPGGQEPAHGD